MKAFKTFMVCLDYYHASFSVVLVQDKNPLMENSVTQFRIRKRYVYVSLRLQRNGEKKSRSKSKSRKDRSKKTEEANAPVAHDNSGGTGALIDVRKVLKNISVK